MSKVGTGLLASAGFILRLGASVARSVGGARRRKAARGEVIRTVALPLT